MSPLAVDGTSQDALANLATRIPDPQDRQWFAEIVSYVQSLPPTDEFVKVAQLFGFLTLIGRELPAHLEEERKQFRKLLLEAHAEFKKQVQTNANYHDQLAERLNRLPQEIANGVKPDDIAKAMAESFRQQIAATGIEETKTLLSAATSDLKRITHELDKAVRPISDRYSSVAVQIEKQAAEIGSQSGKLLRTAESLQAKNSELIREMRSLEWYWYVAVALILVLLGGVVGAMWEHRNVGDLVSDLQQQIAQLEQIVKTQQQPAQPSTTGIKRAGKH